MTCRTISTTARTSTSLVSVLLLSAFTRGADTVDAAHRVAWRADVAEGSYADAASWTDGVTPMAAGKYGLIDFRSRDVTVTAPPEGLSESTGTIFYGTGSGTHTLTIDTRGTWWEKRGVVAAQHWWGFPFAQNLAGSHIFNFEDLPTTANDRRIWRFEDARFTWRSTGTSQQDFDLWSGTMCFDYPVFLGSNGGRVNFTIHPEAKIDATAGLRQRGNAVTRTTFLGGRHRINGIVLKDANAGAGRTELVLTNDAFVSSYGGVDFGSRADQNQNGLSTGIAHLFNTSRLDVTNGVRLGAGSRNAPFVNLRNQGEIHVHDEATLFSVGHVDLGYTMCSTGLVTVAGNGTFATADSGSNIQLGTMSNAVGRIVVQDDATFTCGGVLSIGMDGTNVIGVVTLKDRAHGSCGLVSGNWVQMARSQQNAYARLEIMDDAVFRLGDGASIEQTVGGTSRAEIALSGKGCLLGGGWSCLTNRSDYAGRTSLTLADNAVVSLKAIYGAAPSTGEPAMTLAADGGTLALSTATPGVPYLSGCVATLGARGLTFDVGVRDVVVDQAFTPATGANDAAIRKVGDGALVVWRDSTHPKTVVSGGTLRFAHGATRFGNVLELATGACLALTDDSATISADAISFDGNLVIHVPENCTLDEPHPLLMLKTPLSDEAFANVVVGNPQSGRNYALSRNADGTSVSVTVTAASAGTCTWTGAKGTSWNDAANWEPAGVPTHNDVVVVSRAATISIDAPAFAGTLDIATTDAVEIAGDASLYVADDVAVPKDGRAVLSTPIRRADGRIAKTGAGTLAVSGNNVDTMYGRWRLDGGTTVFESAASLGADREFTDALALSNCTFRYTGAATTVVRPWQLNGEYPAVFDIVGDLTFDAFKISLAQRDNGIVKTGAGALTLDVPVGTTTLSTYGKAERGSNKDVSGVFTPVDGEVSGWAGLGQLTVLDGTLSIRGQGMGVSTVKQEHHALLGGAGWLSSTAPELHLKDVTFVQGSGQGYHMLMDMDVPSGGVASRLVIENAKMECNGLYVGYSRTGSSELLHPVLAITNGTLNVTWNLEVPRSAAYAPIVRVGAGGMLSRDSITVAGGLTFDHRLDARFEDGGCLKVVRPQNFFLGGSAQGEVVFANGGGMIVHRFLARNGSTTATCAFDGGYARFTLNGGISCANNPTSTCFRADAGGARLDVPNGIEHVLAVPLRGEGVFTKTGGGTLVLTNDLRVAIQSEQPVYTPLASRTVMAANKGGIVVSEGTLRCVAGTTDASSRFSGTGTLSGAFTTLTLAVEPGATAALALVDVTAEKVVVDFGRADDDPVASGTTAAVARLATEEAFRAFVWKGVNAGARVATAFSYDAETGLVTATLRRSGMAVIIR